MPMRRGKIDKLHPKKLAGCRVLLCCRGNLEIASKLHHFSKLLELWLLLLQIGPASMTMKEHDRHGLTPPFQTMAERKHFWLLCQQALPQSRECPGLSLLSCGIWSQSWQNFAHELLPGLKPRKRAAQPCTDSSSEVEVTWCPRCLDCVQTTAWMENLNTCIGNLGKLLRCLRPHMLIEPSIHLTGVHLPSKHRQSCKCVDRSPILAAAQMAKRHHKACEGRYNPVTSVLNPRSSVLWKHCSCVAGMVFLTGNLLCHKNKKGILQQMLRQSHQHALWK